MRFNFAKIKAFFERVGFKPFLIGAIVGLPLGVVGPKLFVENVEQNFHFEGNSNWIQFLNDSSLINESFNSLPNSSLNGSEAYANGEFTTVLMLKNTTLGFDSISIFKELGDTETILEGLNQSGIMEFNESEPEFITPMYLYFKEVDAYYIRNNASIKDYSKGQQNSMERIESNECNADFSFSIPAKKLITVKCTKSSIETCLLKKLPSEFYINTPLDYKIKLLNKFLPVDSCKTLLLSHSSNNAMVKFGTNKLNTIINGGKVKINNITYEGDYTIKAHLEQKCNTINLSENKDRPFNVAVSIENASNIDSYFGLVSSARYAFITSPEGLFNLGNNHYEINSLDKLEIYGDLHLSLIYKGRLLPEVSIEGNIYSCKLNHDELLKTRWERLGSDVKGGLVGGLIGFVLSLITMLLKKTTTANKS